MTAQARLFGDIPTATEQADDDREHELDRTPRGVVRQALRRLVVCSPTSWTRGVAGPACVFVAGLTVRRPSPAEPLRVLDWCAGSGVWSSEIRALLAEAGVPVHITAVELRASERTMLERWADTVIIGDQAAALEGQRYDLIIGNPAFSLFVSTLPWLLEHTTAAIILHTTETLQRTEAGADLARALPPVRELGIPGSVRYRGAGTGADSRIYSVSAWVRGHRADSWPRELLPLLPASERGWVEPPGGERVVLPCWPTAPGWSP